MQRENTGMKFTDPSGEIEVKKNCDFFVDDTATGVSEKCINDDESVLEHLRRDEQRYSFLLFAAGYLLALFKCIFYYYSFKLVGTRFVHTTNADLSGNLYLQSKYGGEFEKYDVWNQMNLIKLWGALYQLLCPRPNNMTLCIL